MKQFNALYKIFLYNISKKNFKNIDFVKVLGYFFIFKCGYDFFNNSKLHVWERVKRLSIIQDKINKKRKEIIDQIKKILKKKRRD